MTLAALSLLAVLASAQHEHHQHHHGHEEHGGMKGNLGEYAMGRDPGSGTAWQPESSRHEGWGTSKGRWSIMAHGWAYLVAGRQNGPRGNGKIYSPNMFMGMAQRPLGRGRLT